MDFKLKKTDEKIIRIVVGLYLRHYNFADIYDYITGKDILEIFYERLDGHIKKIPQYITDSYKETKEQIFKIIRNKDIKGVAIYKFKIKDIIERYKNTKNFSKNIVEDLENDMEEMEEILIKKSVSFSEKEKSNSEIYKMLKNEDYENLKKMKLNK